MAVRSGVVCDGRLADRQQLSGIDLHDANIKDGAAIIVIELQLGTRPLHTIIHRVVIRRRNRRIKLIILEYEIRSVAVQLICRFSAFPFGIRQFRAAGHDVNQSAYPDWRQLPKSWGSDKWHRWYPSLRRDTASRCHN